MRAEYIPGEGMLVTIQGPTEGVNFMLGEWMTIAAIQRYVHEVEEWLS